jgi:Sulfotransferase family
VDRTRPTTVLYILGSSRTGSGILARFLSTIEGTAYAGELRRLYSRGIRPGRTCSCGRSHSDCPVWSKLLIPGASHLQPSLAELGRIQREAAPDRHPWFAALRYIRRSSPPEPQSSAGRYLAAYAALHESFGEATGANVIINSSKSPADAALLALAPSLSVRCVQMVRDPRAVAFSFQKHAGKNAGLAGRMKALGAAFSWLGKQVTGELVRRRYPRDRWVVVGYERFCEDPRPTVEAVAKWLAVPPPLADLRPGIPLTVQEAHGPDGSRWRRFVGTEVVLEEDDRWRRDMHPLDRFLVTLVTFPLLHRYGYPIRTARAET